MNRALELTIILILLPILIFVFIIISLIIFFSSGKKIIFWSKRIGKNNKIFLMPKFRTMKINTPDVATHLLDKPEKYITTIGSFLRKYSLDELPTDILDNKRSNEFNWS